MSQRKGGAVLKAIAATAELTGTEISEAALLVFESDLSAYPESDVLAALTRCRRELRGRLTISDVLDRISAAGGHPTANEAWALVISSQDEAETVVLTDQVAEAAAVAQPIIDSGDEVGARMAFRDAYDRIIRDRQDAPRWFPSLGTNVAKRQIALERAVLAGRLQKTHIDGLLPPPPPNEKGQVIVGLLSGDIPSQMPRDQEFKSRIATLLKQLKGNKAA